MPPHLLQTGEKDYRSPQFNLLFSFSLPDIPSRLSITLRKFGYKLLNLIIPFLSQKINAGYRVEPLGIFF